MRNPIHHLSKMSLHEAAHAVIARALGIDLDGEVCMRTGDKDTSAGVTTVSAGSLAKSAGPEAQIEGYEKDAKVALAAPIAQERLFPVGDEAADDIARAQTAIVNIAMLASRKPIPDEVTTREKFSVVLDRLLQETETLVTKHWAEIGRVAKALEQHDRIDQTELDRLIRTAKVTRAWS